jgi:SagB-type dehydrogenase family enzyme
VTTAISFRSGVALQCAEDVVIVTYADKMAFKLSKLSAGLVKALNELTETPRGRDELDAGLDERQRGQLATIMKRIDPLITRDVVAGGRVLASFEMLARDASYSPAEVGEDTPVKLSKFAYFHRREGVLALESPLAVFRCLLPDALGRRVVTELATISTARQLAGPDGSAAEIAELLSHLAGAGYVDIGESEVDFPADSDEVLRQWDFHDLLFHSRARMGRTDEPYGGRFPYVGEIEPLPAIKQPPAGDGIDLPRPELGALLETDPNLISVMEGRQSVRSYGEKPITLAQLGEFLYRTARVRGTYGPRADDGMPYQGSSRPYPCGGAGYELELYLTIRRTEGLEPGIYFYDPEFHRLHLVNDDEADRVALLAVASTSTGGLANPDLLITMCSRFQRISWKYQSIAYSVTLKHAGVLYSTMYLVATAMGLAPCGLGSGDSELASRAFKLDYLRESAVGEFLLGSLPEQLPQPESVRRLGDWQGGNDPQWQQEVQRLLPGYGD